MKGQWNITIATTMSMLITLTVRCIFESMRSNHLLQQVKDEMNLYMLSLPNHSSQDRLNYTMYNHRLIVDDNNLYAVILLEITLILSVVSLLCYGKQVFNYFRMVIYTVLIVWLMARYCDNQNCWYQLDILTVYFIAWQFMYLMCKWEFAELSWPLLILQQASCCVSTSITAFFMYDIVFRSVPFRFFIGFLWLYSLYDIVACLYINGRFRKMLPQLESREVIPCDVYFVCDIEDDEEDDESYQEFLGLGDFTVYNFMVLFIMHPILSTVTKIFVALGCIACIQVGYYGLKLIGQKWHARLIPGLPIPVIVFSMYAIIVDFVMNYTIIDCNNVLIDTKTFILQ